MVLAARTPQRIARYHTMLVRWKDSGARDPESLLLPWYPEIWKRSYLATLDCLCAYFEVDAALKSNAKVSDGSRPPMIFDLSCKLSGWLPFAGPNC
jgi:hypothetical protein